MKAYREVWGNGQVVLCASPRGNRQGKAPGIHGVSQSWEACPGTAEPQQDREGDENQRAPVRAGTFLQPLRLEKTSEVPNPTPPCPLPHPRLWDTPMDGDPTTPGQLCHCSTALWEKNLLPVSNPNAPQAQNVTKAESHPDQHRCGSEGASNKDTSHLARS